VTHLRRALLDELGEWSTDGQLLFDRRRFISPREVGGDRGTARCAYWNPDVRSASRRRTVCGGTCPRGCEQGGSFDVRLQLFRRIAPDCTPNSMTPNGTTRDRHVRSSPHSARPRGLPRQSKEPDQWHADRFMRHHRHPRDARFGSSFKMDRGVVAIARRFGLGEGALATISRVVFTWQVVVGALIVAREFERRPPSPTRLQDCGRLR
jgi:hypothetical protein